MTAQAEKVTPVLVSFTIVTRDRSADVAALLDGLASQINPNYEILVGDNASTPSEANALRAAVRCHANASIYRFEENLGVSGGRNRLLERCRGDLIVELDDDIAPPQKTLIDELIALFQKDAGLGAAAFKIVNYHTGNVDRHEFPFLNKRRDPNLEGDAAWFIGCGHCFRADMLEEIGVYRDFAPYGMEEFDLSYRILDRGWRIRYFPSIEIHHKKSPVHRVTNYTMFVSTALAQRTKAALLNLPVIMCISQFVIRGLLYSKCGKHPSVFTKAFKQLWRDRDYIKKQRTPIQAKTVLTLLKLRGPLFF